MEKIVSEDGEAIDMISYLPKEIIHKIMSILPTTLDSTRMSVLSKTFRFLFLSSPVLDIDFDQSFRPNTLFDNDNWSTDVLQFVRDSIGPRDSVQPTLDRLTFRSRDSWPSVDPIADTPNLETAVQLLASFALNHGAKELALEFWAQLLPGLPRAVFGSRSIKKLDLSGLSLDSSSSNDLMVVFNCPLLEDLALTGCSCSTNKLMRLASPRLKAAKLDCCSGIEKIEIDTATTARSLESFTYHRADPGNSKSCEISGLSSCSALKYLELKRLEVSDNHWFTADVSLYAGLETLVLKECNSVTRVSGLNRCLKTLDLQLSSGVVTLDSTTPNLRDLRLTSVEVSDFPGTLLGFKLLESLVLIFLDWIEEMVLSSNSLRRLAISDCKILSRMEIEAPNLVSFDYAGDVLPRPILVPADAHSGLMLYLDDEKGLDLKALSEFLSRLGSSKTVTLDCYSSETLIFPRDVRDTMASPLRDLRRLTTRVDETDVLHIAEFLDSLLWLVPRPETISIYLEFECLVRLEFDYSAGYELHEDEGDELRCCFSKAIKCWRHHLVRVDLKVFQSFRHESNWQSYFMKNTKAALTLKRTTQLIT